MSANEHVGIEPEEPAVGGGPGQVPGKDDLAARRPARPNADERPSDPDVAATTLDSGSIGVGSGGTADGAGTDDEPDPLT